MWIRIDGFSVFSWGYGEKDEILPIYGVEKGCEMVQKIYEQEGAKENCRFVKTPKGHWWCEDIVWDTIAEETEKLGG